MTRSTHPNRGFTLLELMIGVAVAGALAAVVVPQFLRESRKVRYDAEVSAVFAELANRELQYKVDNGAFVAAPACLDAPDDRGADVAASCMADGSAWNELHVQAPESTIRCSYEVSTGCRGDVADPPAGVEFETGEQSWYFVVAYCGTGAGAVTYFTGSTDTHIQKIRGKAPFTASAASTCALPELVASASAGGTGGSSGGASGGGTTGGSSGAGAGGSGGAGAGGSSGAGAGGSSGAGAGGGGSSGGTTTTTTSGSSGAGAGGSSGGTTTTTTSGAGGASGGTKTTTTPPTTTSGSGGSGGGTTTTTTTTTSGNNGNCNSNGNTNAHSAGNQSQCKGKATGSKH